jgi:hypothetical protein
MFRSGNCHIVSLCDDTPAGAAAMLKCISDYIVEGKVLLTLNGVENNLSSVFRVADIIWANTFTVDLTKESENEEREKENKLLHHRLLEEQVKYYTNVHNGDDWWKNGKKDSEKEPWE